MVIYGPIFILTTQKKPWRRERYFTSNIVLKDDYIVLKCLLRCMQIFFFYFTYLTKMSSNFARFVGQFWIQNPIILDGFKFSVPLISGGGRAAQGLWTEHQPVGELLVFQPVFFSLKK